MNREAMIRKLVSYSVEAALREPQSYWLQELFEKGFAGYRRFSDSRLRRELELRGLDETEEPDVEDDAPFDDVDIDDTSESFAPYVVRGKEYD